MRGLLQGLGELGRYPSAILGLIIIASLVGVSIYTVIAIPYSEAIRLWRGGEDMWRENPRNALPAWVNLPQTIVLSTIDGGEKSVRPLGGAAREVTALITFDYNFDIFPSELALFFETTYEKRQPFLSLRWLTPDGREIKLGERAVKSGWYSLSLDKDLRSKLGGLEPEKGLFGDPTNENVVPLRGTYKLLIQGYLFEESSDLDVKLVIYGKAYGLAGTDHRRRDLMVGLLWGAPVALSFGFLAALGSTLITFVIAAIATWYGGWLDAAVQRITEIRMILPTLPILIMIGALYSRSILTILGAVIILGIVSGSIKTYRAMFLQVKQSPYIEAARAYGAGNFHIIFRYLIPRLLPVLIPNFVILIPEYVFLEATLAILGLGDPILPTWGKIIQEARDFGALYKGYYYWMLEPAFLLMLTGFGFALVGFALDRIFNPRLRTL